MRPWQSTKKEKASQQLRLRNSNQRKSKNKSPNNSQRRNPRNPSLLILNHLLKGLSKLTTKTEPGHKEEVTEAVTVAKEELEVAEEAIEVGIDPSLQVEVKEEKVMPPKVMTTKSSEVEAAEEVTEAEENTVEEVKEEAKEEAEAKDNIDPKQQVKVKAVPKEATKV